MFKGFAVIFLGGLVGWVYTNIFPSDEITPIVVITASMIYGFYSMWRDAEEDNNRD